MTTQPTGRAERRLLGRRTPVAALALVAVIAGVFIGLTLRSPRNPPSRGVAIVEAMFATYSDAGPVAALRHFSPEVAERFGDHMSGLAVWNDRLTVVTPCRDGRAGAIICVMSEQHDLHEAAGLAPFRNTFTFRVNVAGEIDYISQSVPDHFRTYYTFRSRYRIWLDAHPDAAGTVRGFPGNYQGPNPYFDAESAQAALDFIDDFVASSGDYPPPPG